MSEGNRSLRRVGALSVLGLVMLLVSLGIIVSQQEEVEEQAPLSQTGKVVETPSPTTEDETDVEIVFPDEMTDTELKQLIAAHINAVGGLQRLRDLKNLTVFGNIEREGHLTPFTVVRKRPRFWMASYQLRNKERTDYYNGHNAWRRDEWTDRERTDFHPIEGTKLDRVRALADFDDPIIRYVLSDLYPDSVHDLKISLGEQGVLEGQNGYWIYVVDGLGIERTVFLSADNYLITYMEVAFEGRTTTVEYDGHSDVGGVTMPSRIRVTHSGTSFSTIEVIDKYRINGIVFDAVFTPVEE